MNKTIYKTEEGRNIVESMYKNILAGYLSYPFEQLFVPTKIAQTHILRFGDKSKPPLIMIHGSVSNSASWLGSISDFIDNFCIYCVDIPGEPGLSEPNRCSLSSGEPYEWLSSLLDYLNIEKAYFVTMSLGSWYALNFAMHSPGKVRALSMITSGGLVPAKASFIFKAVFFMMLGKLGQKMLNRSIYHKTEVPPEVLEFQAITSRHFNPVLETLPIFSDAQLKKITFPIQFFGGECDALINSVKTAERLKKLVPHSDIHILKDTGHAIIDQFSVVKDFLTSN
jgi:pimeloyl-ACP methyl ester carboxylesterase